MLMHLHVSSFFSLTTDFIWRILLCTTNFQVDGDEDEPEVGEGGLVEPVVAGGGLR